MSSIPSLLEYARNKKASEILVHSGKPAQMRLGKTIVPMGGRQADPQLLVSEILNEEEKRKLFESLQIQGSRVINSIPFKFDFQIDFEGMSGALELENQNPSLWQLPGLLIDSVTRGQGLHLICGPRRSGKTSALKSLINSMAGKNKVIAIYSDEEIMGIEDSGNLVSQLSIQQLRSNGILNSADVVILDSQKDLLCEEALALAEQGVCVVMTLPFMNLQIGLQRFLDLSSGSTPSKARRLAMVIRSGLGIRLLSGIDSPLQGAFEFLVSNSNVQKNLLEWGNQQSLTGFDSWMNQTMNQTLFQLLMKRKIEIKIAFDNSPNPEELDVMLKKVGI
jgi:twitching motility protein PilT